MSQQATNLDSNARQLTNLDSNARQLTNLDSNARQLVYDLAMADAIKRGTYTLRGGGTTDVYIDLRVLVGHPILMKRICHAMWRVVKSTGADFESQNGAVLCGLAYAALPMAAVISTHQNVPMVVLRKEAKAYGTKRLVEGVYSPGQECVVLDDVISDGGSKFEAVRQLREQADPPMTVRHVVVLVDRRDPAVRTVTDAQFEQLGIQIHSVYTLDQIRSVITPVDLRDPGLNPQDSACSQDPRALIHSSYGARADAIHHAAKIYSIHQIILQCMQKKQTNICLSVDLSNPADILRIADAVGPHVCMIKTHIDLIDFSDDGRMSQDTFLRQLASIGCNHEFVLFEDRKYADIGATVHSQLAQIAKYVDLVTVHALTGPAMLDALRQQEYPVSALVVAQMSSAGAFSTDYIAMATELACANSDVVVGMVSQQRMTADPRMLCVMPGINLDTTADRFDQRYRTPEAAVAAGADVLVVGRGITGAWDPADPDRTLQHVVDKCTQYRTAGWIAATQHWA